MDTARQALIHTISFVGIPSPLPFTIISHAAVMNGVEEEGSSIGMSQHITGDEHASATSMVFGLPDMTSIIATMLGEGCVFPFVMVCKSCYTGTKGAGLKLKSDMKEICSSIALLAWARSQSHPCPWNVFTSYSAAKWGNLAVLEWMRAQSPPCSWDERTCSQAARWGQLAALQWMRAQSPPCPWGEMTCYHAAQGGQLAVLRWMRAQSPPCSWNEWTCTAAAEEGHLAVLQWMRAQSPPCPWDEDTCYEEAAAEGHSEVLEWLEGQ